MTGELERFAGLGIPAVMLFGIPATKDAEGSQAWADDGVICAATRRIKETWADLLVVADTCLCEYTDHGHCGVPVGRRSGQMAIDNDPTLEILAKAALAYVEAGAHVVAPSDMMDGRVSAIRRRLDQEDYPHIPILSYAAKYSSAFYGPFRDAAESAPQFGDRKSYQMDPANSREALKEVGLDLEEGADMVMVKPALPYLDIIYQVRQLTDVPVAAYQVSGEYSSLCAAFQNGWLNRDAAIRESLLSIRRAGADLILTYFAKEAAQLMARGEF
jgi:porphobilinogen synthase